MLISDVDRSDVEDIFTQDINVTVYTRRQSHSGTVRWASTSYLPAESQAEVRFL